ncbi:MAG: replication factor C large subunit [Candidatus Bathyarchaeia archaeon]
MTSWTEKYRPATIGEILGNEQAKSEAVRWLKRWRPGDKPLLLYGPPGTGKTTLVHVLARQFNYNLVEMNTSDQRTEAKINEVAGLASRYPSLDRFFDKKEGVIIFLDEVDGIYGREDYGGVSAILKIIAETQAPIIMAANDITGDNISTLVNVSQKVRLFEVRIPILITMLRHVLREESVKVDEEALRLIAVNSRGDVRSALNDLQRYVLGKALKKEALTDLWSRPLALNLQDALVKLTNVKTIDEARSIFESSSTPFYRDEVILAIHDNLPLLYKGNYRGMAEAYEKLSRADVILGRMKDPSRSRWYLIPYLQETLALIFISTPPSSPLSGLFYPPQKIILMGRTKKERAIRNSISSKIKVRCHLSTRAAATVILPYLRVLSRSGPKAADMIHEWLGLTEEEATYLAKA